jgi:hypothetical protein
MHAACQPRQRWQAAYAQSVTQVSRRIVGSMSAEMGWSPPRKASGFKALPRKLELAAGVCQSVGRRSPSPSVSRCVQSWNLAESCRHKPSTQVIAPQAVHTNFHGLHSPSSLICIMRPSGLAGACGGRCRNLQGGENRRRLPDVPREALQRLPRQHLMLSDVCYDARGRVRGRGDGA